MSFLTSIFNPGDKYLGRAQRHLKRAAFQGGNITGPGGIGGGFNFDANGTLSSNMSLGDFAPYLQQLLTTAGGGLNAAQGNTQQYADLGSIFQNALSTANADPFAIGSMVADKLRPGLERAQDTLRNNTFDQLFNRGKSANSAAASPILEGLSNTLAEQNQQLDITGLNIGRGLQGDAMSRIAAALAGQNQIQTTGFNVGMGAIQGAGALQQLPMQYLQAIAALQGARSNTELGIAGANQQSASQAQSTFMNATDWLSGLFGAGGAFPTAGS